MADSSGIKPVVPARAESSRRRFLQAAGVLAFPFIVPGPRWGRTERSRPVSGSPWVCSAPATAVQTT